MVELRRHPRVPIDVAVEFVVKGSTERLAGRCKDASLGGMFIQTESPAAFGTELVVFVARDGRRAPLALPAVVRWTRARQGMGVQFGLMGARETHAMAELTRGAAGAGRAAGRAVGS